MCIHARLIPQNHAQITPVTAHTVSSVTLTRWSRWSLLTVHITLKRSSLGAQARGVGRLPQLQRRHMNEDAHRQQCKKGNARALPRTSTKNWLPRCEKFAGRGVNQEQRGHNPLSLNLTKNEKAPLRVGTWFQSHSVKENIFCSFHIYTYFMPRSRTLHMTLSV